MSSAPFLNLCARAGCFVQRQLALAPTAAGLLAGAQAYYDALHQGALPVEALLARWNIDGALRVDLVGQRREALGALLGGLARDLRLAVVLIACPDELHLLATELVAPDHDAQRGHVLYYLLEESRTQPGAWDWSWVHVLSSQARPHLAPVDLWWARMRERVFHPRRDVHRFLPAAMFPGTHRPEVRARYLWEMLVFDVLFPGLCVFARPPEAWRGAARRWALLMDAHAGLQPQGWPLGDAGAVVAGLADLVRDVGEHLAWYFFNFHRVTLTVEDFAEVVQDVVRVWNTVPDETSFARQPWLRAILTLNQLPAPPANPAAPGASNWAQLFARFRQNNLYADSEDLFPAILSDELAEEPPPLLSASECEELWLRAHSLRFYEALDQHLKQLYAGLPPEAAAAMRLGARANTSARFFQALGQSREARMAHVGVGLFAGAPARDAARPRAPGVMDLEAHWNRAMAQMVEQMKSLNTHTNAELARIAEEAAKVPAGATGASEREIVRIAAELEDQAAAQFAAARAVVDTLALELPRRARDEARISEPVFERYTADHTAAFNRLRPDLRSAELRSVEVPAPASRALRVREYMKGVYDAANTLLATVFKH